MSWFNVFSKNRVDKDILDLYLEIEQLIIKTDDILTNYLNIISNNYHKSKNKNEKLFNSVNGINSFFKKMKNDYAFCYTLRKNKNHYQIHKNNKSTPEKKIIESKLKQILEQLTTIYSTFRTLDKKNIDEKVFVDLEKNIENSLEIGTSLKNIKTKYEHKIVSTISEIRNESLQNANAGKYLTSKSGNKNLFFSQNLSINDIKYLDLVPLLELKSLKNISLFINELHKDEHLPIDHYTLKLDKRTIYVIPSEYKQNLKQFLKD